MECASEYFWGVQHDSRVYVGFERVVLFSSELRFSELRESVTALLFERFACCIACVCCGRRRRFHFVFVQSVEAWVAVRVGA